MHEPRDPEALRRRLYRPGAQPEDLEAYADATTGVGHAAPDRAPTGDGAAERPLARRPRVVAVVAGAVVTVLIGAALLSGVFAPSAPQVAALAPSTSPDAAPTVAAAEPPTPDTDTTGVLIVESTSITDTGRRPGAGGTAEETSPGIWRYAVARGDGVSGVAARFTICRSDVLLALPYGFDWPDVRPGQLLVLSRAETGDPDAPC